MITIIDYGAGNIGSIVNMIKKIGGMVRVSSDKSEINDSEKLLLPGVGSFDHGMMQLINSGLVDVLNKKVLVEKVPILGICLGVQLFTKGSEEGILKGLGWFNAETIKFKVDNNPGMKIPHMGWNQIKAAKESRILTGLDEESRFYFVHSYHLQPNDESEILATTEYWYPFVSAMERENIVGCQFHPEKSHKFGMKIFKNFIDYY